MRNKTPKDETVTLSGPTDHKRIVSLKLPENITKIAGAEPSLGGERLVYNNGILLEGVKVYTIFLGNYWTQNPGITRDDINQFFQYILLILANFMLLSFLVQNPLV